MSIHPYREGKARRHRGGVVSGTKEISSEAMRTEDQIVRLPVVAGYKPFLKLLRAVRLDRLDDEIGEVNPVSCNERHMRKNTSAERCERTFRDCGRAVSCEQCLLMYSESLCYDGDN